MIEKHGGLEDFVVDPFGFKYQVIMYSNFRNYAPPLDVKGGIIAEKVVPVFSESSFLACFGLVM